MGRKNNRKNEIISDVADISRNKITKMSWESLIPTSKHNHLPNNVFNTQTSIYDSFSTMKFHILFCN